MAKRLPTEFGINMFLEKVLILQQADLESVGSYEVFDENSPCHIYFVCRRPRVVIDPDESRVSEESIFMLFKVQRQNKFEDIPLLFENPFKDASIVIESAYPHSTFKFLKNGQVLVNAKAAVFLQEFNLRDVDVRFLDLEVLYIGQSYGVNGARTAPDRLKSHSTLQGIYSESIQKNPDFEIWLVLASFQQINIVVMDGRTEYTDEELETDSARAETVRNRLYDGINEQQRINFTEAALIRYFEPPYNIEYKNSFPNPAHKTYAECYELNINSVSVELCPIESVGLNFYSESIERKYLHIKTFLLHSPEERRSMFDILPTDHS